MNYSFGQEGSIVLYTTISPKEGGSILRNPRVQVPGPRQNAASEIENRLETSGRQKLGHLRAAAAGTANHHEFLLRIEFAQTLRNLRHGDVYAVAGDRRHGDF